jgi:hypothetical protein
MKTRCLIAFAGATVLALSGCTGGSNNAGPSAQTNTAANNSSPVVQPEVYAQQKTEMASLNQAVQQYKAAEGRYPKTLHELVPTYLAKIPPAPAGCKINYDPNSGVVSVARQ